MKLRFLSLYAALMTFAVSTRHAFAATTPPDLTPLTSGVDFSTVIAAILAIGVLAIGLELAEKAVQRVQRMVRRA